MAVLIDTSLLVDRERAAGSALAYGLGLATRDDAYFARVPGLRVIGVQ